MLSRLSPAPAISYGIIVFLLSASIAVAHNINFNHLADIQAIEALATPQDIRESDEDDYDMRLSVREERFLFIEGTLSIDTPLDFLYAFRKNPHIRWVVFGNVPGSVDDEANLEAAYYLRSRGVNTYLLDGGSMSSGGTDLFLAGNHRYIAKNSEIGVHSWIFENEDGTIIEGGDLEIDDPEHLFYTQYYEDLGIHQDFYAYTIQAAKADDMHWMSTNEIAYYHIGEIVDIK